MEKEKDGFSGPNGTFIGIGWCELSLQQERFPQTFVLLNEISNEDVAESPLPDITADEEPTTPGKPSQTEQALPDSPVVAGDRGNTPLNDLTSLVSNEEPTVVLSTEFAPTLPDIGEAQLGEEETNPQAPRQVTPNHVVCVSNPPLSPREVKERQAQIHAQKWAATIPLPTTPQLSSMIITVTDNSGWRVFFVALIGIIFVVWCCITAKDLFKPFNFSNIPQPNVPEFGMRVVSYQPKHIIQPTIPVLVEPPPAETTVVFAAPVRPAKHRLRYSTCVGPKISDNVKCNFGGSFHRRGSRSGRIGQN